MRRTIAALALALPACSGPPSVPAPDRPHAAPLTADEEAVRKWVLDNADDPGSVEFAGWGPDAEVEHVGGSKSRVVRVRYREKNKAGARVLRDRLVYIRPGDGRMRARDNEAGDDWKRWHDLQLKSFQEARKPERPPAPPAMWGTPQEPRRADPAGGGRRR